MFKLSGPRGNLRAELGLRKAMTFPERELDHGDENHQAQWQGEVGAVLGAPQYPTPQPPLPMRVMGAALTGLYCSGEGIFRALKARSQDQG